MVDSNHRQAGLFLSLLAARNDLELTAGNGGLVFANGRATTAAALLGHFVPSTRRTVLRVSARGRRRLLLDDSSVGELLAAHKLLAKVPSVHGCAVGIDGIRKDRSIQRESEQIGSESVN